SADGPPRLDEARERMLPHALFLQAPEEAFDHAVLLWRIRRDELLAQAVVPTCRAEPTALEDQAVVAAQDRRGPVGTQGPEAVDAGFLERPPRFLRAAPPSELVPHHPPILPIHPSA